MLNPHQHLKSALSRVLLLVAFCLTSSGQFFAQQSAASTQELDARKKAVSYTFVSPNTREGLTLDEAIKLLNSPEELRLANDVQWFSICLGVRPLVLKTIGSWSDGAEHSMLVRVYLDQNAHLYTAAQLGRIQRQKSVLNFRRGASGAGRMYVISLRRRKPLASISRTLDATGVMFRTLVPARRRPTVVYVVDLENKLRKQVAVAARKLGARLGLIKGSGAFIGDDDREKAQAVFAEAISKYEAENPVIARKCAR